MRAPEGDWSLCILNIVAVWSRAACAAPPSAAPCRDPADSSRVGPSKEQRVRDAPNRRRAKMGLAEWLAWASPGSVNGGAGRPEQQTRKERTCTTNKRGGMDSERLTPWPRWCSTRPPTLCAGGDRPSGPTPALIRAYHLLGGGRPIRPRCHALPRTLQAAASSTSHF